VTPGSVNIHILYLLGSGAVWSVCSGKCPHRKPCRRGQK